MAGAPQSAPFVEPDAEFTREPSAPFFAALLLLFIQVLITLLQYWYSGTGLGAVRRFQPVIPIPGAGSLAEAMIMIAVLLHLFRSFCGLNFLANDNSFKGVLRTTAERSPLKIKIEWFLRVFFIVDQGVYVWALRSDYTAAFLALIAAQSAGLFLYQLMFWHELYVEDPDHRTNLLLLVGDLFFILYTIALVVSQLVNPLWPGISVIVSVGAYFMVFLFEIICVYWQSLRTEAIRVRTFLFVG